MEEDKLIELCRNGNLGLDQLFDLLLNNSGWVIDSPEDIEVLLDALSAYAVKNDINNFYELIRRFTLSECFGEDES